MISGKIVEEMEGDLFAAPLSMALGQPKKKEHLSSEMIQGRLDYVGPLGPLWATWATLDHQSKVYK